MDIGNDTNYKLSSDNIITDFKTCFGKNLLEIYAVKGIIVSYTVIQGVTPIKASWSHTPLQSVMGGVGLKIAS